MSEPVPDTEYVRKCLNQDCQRNLDDVLESGCHRKACPGVYTADNITDEEFVRHFKRDGDHWIASDTVPLNLM